MAKILISPLGVGGRFKSADGSDTSEREYKNADYKISDKIYPGSRFVASVLCEHFQLDGIIFIGTVKSMWEEVYRFFCEKNHVDIDENYWFNLAQQIDKLNYNSSLDSLDLSKVRDVLGDPSQCILTKYGLDEIELWENFDKIIHVIKSLRNGDELYLDITHSFRSLSLFQFLAITFINDLLSEKEIKISGVYYGMLDVSTELGYTPIVDLKSLFDITSWIKGAYSLKNYGNGELIAELLKLQGEEDLSNRIYQVSQAVNINYVNAIKQCSSELNSSLSKIIQNKPFNHIKNILHDFVAKFTRGSKSEADFQLELAGWYFDNHRYATGYITLAEAIITYACEIKGKDIRAIQYRQDMKKLLHKPESRHYKLAEIYKKVDKIRNSVAHALLEADRRTERYQDAITNAKEYHLLTQKIFATKTFDI